MLHVKLPMRTRIFTALLGLALAGCAEHHHVFTVAPVSRPAGRVLTDSEVLLVARQAHSAMTVYPAKYELHAFTVERQGANRAVHVWLFNPGSGRMNIADWDAQGEVFLISDDGRVIAYDPNVFP